MDWLDDILGVVRDVGRVIGPIAQVAAPIIGASVASDANEDAAQTIIQATNAQADQLQLGIDERLIAQLGGLDKARELLDRRIAATTKIIEDANTKYGGDVRRAAQDYARTMPQAAALIGDMLTGGAIDAASALRSAASGFGADMVSAGDMYGSRVTGAADAAAGTLMQGAERFSTDVMKGPAALAERLGPYANVGPEMLARMREIALSDPSRLTPSQRIALDEARTGYGNRLATSGLLGSGAAIAAAMKAEGELRGGFFDDNQERIDGFLRSLGDVGYRATGAIADAERAAYERAAGVTFEATSAGAQLRNQAHQLAASAAMQARQRAAQLGMDAEKWGQDAYLRALNEGARMQWDGTRLAADRLYSTERDVAGQNLRTADAIRSDLGQYYNAVTGYATTEADLIGGAAEMKRRAEASSLGPIGAVNANVTTANTDLWGKAMGTLTRTIANERAQGVRPSGYEPYGSDAYYTDQGRPGHYETDPAGRIIGGI